MLVDQVVLALAACALGGAALRLSALITCPGTEPRSGELSDRILVAAPLAAGFAISWTLALGLFGSAGSVLALAAGPIAAWLAIRWLAPAPSLSVIAELAIRWTGASRRQRIFAFALAGVAVGCIVEVARQPALNLDALSYHLADVVGWLHSGHAGAVQTFSYDYPVGFYPITNELLVAWILGISRSLGPLAVFSTAISALGLLAVWRLLVRLRVPTTPGALAVAAIATLPIFTNGLNTAAPGTDTPAFTWLACTAALTAGAAERPALLGPALLAAALGVGTKTTVAPLAVVALLLGAWSARAQLSRAWRWLAIGAIGGVIVGAPWYIRDTIDHGWPLWPFSSGPTGDPLPHTITLFHASFLSRPVATVSAGPHAYVQEVGGGLALMLGIVAIPLLARSRIALALAALAAAAVLSWASAPFTGLGNNPLLLPLALTTLRYLLPALGMCAVALAVAGRDGSPSLGRPLAIAILAVAIVGNCLADRAEGYPIVPRPQYLLVGAIVGVLLAAAAPAGRPRLPPIVVRCAVAVLAVALVTIAGDGWLRRESRDGGSDAPLLAFMLRQPGFTTGTRPVAFAPVVLASLAGPRLQHPISLIPAREPCSEVRERARRGWVVLQPFRYVAGITTAFDAVACLKGAKPAYDDGATIIYGPLS